MNCENCIWFECREKTESRIEYHKHKPHLISYTVETHTCYINPGPPIDISEREKACSKFEKKINSKTGNENLPGIVLPGRKGY